MLATVDLTLAKSALIVLAGGGAGFINSIVGSGTLISFPTLVGLGFAERAANIANGTGLFPGSLSAVAAQRPELVGQRNRLLRLVPASMLGGITGAILLLTLPGSWFKRIVPFLILFGVGLVLAGPPIQRKLRERNATPPAPPAPPTTATVAAVAAVNAVNAVNASERVGPLVTGAVFLAGIYGGYFGAAQGIILMGILGVGVRDALPRLNATKNVLAGTVNGIAAVVFVINGDVLWSVVGLVAVGSIVGGLLGARVGRKIAPAVLRGCIVVIGIVAATRLLFFT